jgi:hypothetical protein
MPFSEPPCVKQVSLRSEKPIAQVGHSQPVTCDSWSAPGVQIVLLIQVLLERRIRIGPRAEVVRLPANLLRPAFRRVREEWKVWIGLLWLVLTT